MNDPVRLPETARVVSVDASYNVDGEWVPASGTEVARLWLTSPRRRLYWLRHLPVLRRWATVTREIEVGDTITAGEQIAATAAGWLRI